MELPEIHEIERPETTEAEQHRPVRETEVKGRKCIYYKDEVCTAPDCKFKACANCPYGYKYTFAGALKDIFQRVVALTIFFVKSDDVLRDLITVLRGVEIQLNDGARSRKNVRKLNERLDEIVRKAHNENVEVKAKVKVEVKEKGKVDNR